MASVAQNVSTSPTFFQGVGKVICSVAGVVKDVTFWCGRTIKVLTVDYIAPAVAKLWPHVVNFLEWSWSMIKTPVGMGTLGFLACVGGGTALMAISDTEEMEGVENRSHRLGLRVLGGAAFVLAGVAMTTGVFLAVV